ncbi:MAG: hypothetical protein E6929_09790 [Clostridium sp.]|nr:hypothetical protein [Clostridium sp.]
MKELNENSVLEFYLQEIENDKIYFLKNKKEKKKIVSELIYKLKQSVSMNEKIIIAKELWKTLFEASMSSLDSNKDGYDTLFEYFDNYVDFEELIFASDSFYRDHTLHCLWVYFLGEYLIKSDEFSPIFQNMFTFYEEINNLKFEIESLNMKDSFADLYTLYSNLSKMGQLYDTQCCIAALTHDLGYPLKKIDKINKSIKKILPTFSINNYDEFNFNFSNVDQNFISSFLNFLSYNFTLHFTEESVKNSDVNVKKLLEEVFIFENVDENSTLIRFSKDKFKSLNNEELIVVKQFLHGNITIQESPSILWRYSKDFEEYKHGIMSAFLLIKNIAAFRTINLHYSDKNSINQDVNYLDIASKQSILQAISDHTSDGFKITSINNLSSFLSLVDELEEFSRISRANQNREYIEEFCRTNIYMENSWFNIDFTFENTEIDNLDPERAFKGRCQRFLTLFDIPNLDESLNIRLRCIGNLPNNSNIYTLEIGQKYAKIKINDDEMNIPSYLKSNNFYTSEEYSFL